jgi:hypothetical protein
VLLQRLQQSLLVQLTLHLLLDVANSGTVGTNTLTVTPVTRVTSVQSSVVQQAMAQAVAEEPHVVIGPVVDKLMRHRPMGWYGVLGFARYREEALYQNRNRFINRCSLVVMRGWGLGPASSL